jgi:hypothetical protein
MKDVKRIKVTVCNEETGECRTIFGDNSEMTRGVCWITPMTLKTRNKISRKVKVLLDKMNSTVIKFEYFDIDDLGREVSCDLEMFRKYLSILVRE